MSSINSTTTHIPTTRHHEASHCVFLRHPSPHSRCGCGDGADACSKLQQARHRGSPRCCEPLVQSLLHSRQRRCLHGVCHQVGLNHGPLVGHGLCMQRPHARQHTMLRHGHHHQSKVLGSPRCRRARLFRNDRQLRSRHFRRRGHRIHHGQRVGVDDCLNAVQPFLHCVH